MERLDCAVIGAGVIGLATARALLRKGREVVVLEQADQIGSEISSRNSEVIHAGIYYPPGSRKARLCVAGKEALYRYCSERFVEVRRLGKLIVANDEAEVAKLHALQRRAAENGVNDLEFMSTKEVSRIEPALHCQAALLSPSTGILDVHGYMLALQGEIESQGGAIALNTPVVGGLIGDGETRLRIGGNDAMELSCRTVVNAAGLGAIGVAEALEGFPRNRIPRGYLAKGHYLSLAGNCPFDHLIYPLPSPGGLGIHLTLDMGGQARFGPDVEWVDAIDYSLPGGLEERFAESIRRFWPEITASRLRPAYSGIRPKLHDAHSSFADFEIQGPEDHGVPSVVNLFGIESPGITSSLALADEVAQKACAGTQRGSALHG